MIPERPSRSPWALVSWLALTACYSLNLLWARSWFDHPGDIGCLTCAHIYVVLGFPGNIVRIASGGEAIAAHPTLHAIETGMLVATAAGWCAVFVYVAGRLLRMRA